MRTLTIIFLLFGWNFVQAQTHRGSHEISGSGSIAFFDGGSILSIVVNYGYFVTRRLEIGPSAQVTRVSFDTPFGRDVSTSGLVGAFGHVHLGPAGSASVPFIGFEAGAGLGNSGGAMVGLVGGGKLFVTPGAAITPAAFFQVDELGNTQFGARFGVSAFL